MKPARRMGPATSETRMALLDATERVLRLEGYAAVSSRRIAEQAGLKQQLVYYYFHTMDDLIVATFHRLSTRELERLRQALSSDRPLHEIWNVCIHTTDARMISEFMALANRIDALRAEVIRFIKESRAIQVQALTCAFERQSKQGPIPPVGVALLATSLALALNREGQHGVDDGHAEIAAAMAS